MRYDRLTKCWPKRIQRGIHMLLNANITDSHGTNERRSRSNGNGAALGFEAKLWLAADKLRNNMDAAEYKHVVLGLIFLKYISDAFEEQHAKLLAEQDQGADPEDPDEYRAERHLLGSARKPAGLRSRPTPSSRPSASSSTTRWSPSNATTRA